MSKFRRQKSGYMKVALIQLNAQADKDLNISKSVKFVTQASRRGAEFVLLPEVFLYRGDLGRASARATVSENIPGESTRIFMDLAKRYKIHILLGSIYERIRQDSRVYNTSVLVDPAGKIVGKYRKNNLFRANVGPSGVDETRVFRPGGRTRLVQLGNYKIGMSVCFDLRFSALYRSYARKGANVLVVPSSFTKQTGEAHWIALLRARAIENQCYVLAPNQIGKDYRGIQYYGNTVAVDPWGKVLKRASGNTEEIIYVTLDMKEIKAVRSRIQM